MESRLRKWGLGPRSGQWIEYHDRRGLGYAQTDHYLVLRQAIILLECKLSYRPSAWGQMSKLYRPLLEHLYERPCVGVLVCKNTRGADLPLVDLLELVAKPKGSLWAWHYLGH